MKGMKGDAGDAVIRYWIYHSCAMIGRDKRKQTKKGLWVVWEKLPSRLVEGHRADETGLFHGRRGDGLTITGDTGKSHSRSCTRSRWHHQPSRLGGKRSLRHQWGK